ncbi:PstS family phosphate ABC transporter substrate-binding protein [Blastopirellula marina]|uniref:Phosphate-binding protein n=1 Tax=Blastopirellula marina TaxID=124 RepID=A0A2S8F4Y6_9BACT|nr:phosphate ABC transporter substrate-binding protein [Blastopirellula marina]PQO27211.1 phosphate-binding protein [Blastopirellula marina]PTL41358.1 phosphate ABC transporter substrate-binding protein [Blastopirellula marina]
MLRNLAFSFVAFSAWLVPSLAFAQIQVDSDLPVYQRVSGVSGTIKSIGSDTMNNMMTLWAEGFQEIYPNVQIEIEGKGSSTAPPALIQGTATFGPMSRPMKANEIDDFEKRYGYKPTAMGTSIDMLAVYVNKDNPIKGLSLPQVDAIFSTNRKGGEKEDVSRWGQLGVGGALAQSPISLYGRNSASGTYALFKEIALFGGDYKPTVKEQPGSSSVVQGVATDKSGIGYSGIGYKTSDVRALPLSVKGEDYVEPTAENADDYPMSRFLYIYVNYRPGSELDPLRREFLKYIFSQQGQKAVVKDGYLPITAELAAEQLNAVGIKQ